MHLTIGSGERFLSYPQEKYFCITLSAQECKLQNKRTELKYIF